jgi:uncharacterized protein (TIGR02145 family)
MLKKQIIVLILILSAYSISLTSCKKDSDEVTMPIPACEIITPADSTVIQKGALVSVEALVSNMGAGTRVVFWVDTNQIIQVADMPYEFNWNTTEWDTGIYMLRADAVNGISLLSDEIHIILIDTIIPPQAPVPAFSITPLEGTTDTIFTFDASESRDLEDDFEDLLFRWDYEGDGEWDTEFSSAPVSSHRYFHVGHYHPTLEVIDTDTMSADSSVSLVVTHSTTPDPCDGIISIPYGGKVYHTVPVGNQCWLKENLDIGTMIPSEEGQTNNQQIEKYCYNDDSTNCEKYGGLYMWKEAMDHKPFEGGKGICPVGFHMPTDEEWKELEGHTDSQYGIGDPVWDGTNFRGLDAGKNLKHQLGWYSSGNGLNIFGFKVLPGGYWETGFNFTRESEEGYIWTSSHDSGNNALKRSMKYDKDGIDRSYHWDEAAMSVRCIKD